MPWVRDYVRSDGTPVRGHARWAPGARQEMTISAVVALAAVGRGNGNSTTGNGNCPRPQWTVHYPVTFNSTNTVKVQRPQPTVSYPIRFSSPDGDR
jgi:hypothetical protein